MFFKTYEQAIRELSIEHAYLDRYILQKLFFFFILVQLMKKLLHVKRKLNPQGVFPLVPKRLGSESKELVSQRSGNTFRAIFWPVDLN